MIGDDVYFPVDSATLLYGRLTRGKRKAKEALDQLEADPRVKFAYTIGGSFHQHPLLLYRHLLFEGQEEIEAFCRAVIRYANRSEVFRGKPL